MLPIFDSIADPIAVDRWECRRGGRTFTATIQIGRPVPVESDPNGDWCCPVFVETFTGRIIPVMGVGPIDALLNATLFIRRFAEDLDEWSRHPGDHAQKP
ncbi:MAG TPA: hypothetical protein VIM11_25520 [Tepidisphaeraceae bacterium]|jgi:hypothetical protein